MKKLISILFVLTSFIISQPKVSEISSAPGSFARNGFGPRGIAMGNAMTANYTGNLSSFYNPAVTPYQDGNSIQTAYSFLSLDRTLNYLSFTRRFDFYSKGSAVPRSSAGFTAGIINSGVSKIDGRDNQGNKTGDLSTSENLFFIGLANKFSPKFSMGINVKLYYYKLYEKITTTAFGIDLGALYRFNTNLSASFVLQDLNSKYKWDTSPIYDQEGSITTDNFPLLKKIGLSYNNQKDFIASAEFEFSNMHSKILRFGIEYMIIENLFLRGGIDKIDLANKDNYSVPALGFAYYFKTPYLNAGFEYTYAVESYSPQNKHIIGLNIIL